MTDYKVGSQPPKGYVAWQEWAEAQHEGGLKQIKCPTCKRWLFLKKSVSVRID